MSYASNLNLKHKTITVDLSRTFVIDNAAVLSSANIVSANGATKTVNYVSLTNLLNLDKEPIVITDVSVTKTEESATVASNSVTNKLVIARNPVSANLDTKTPTLGTEQRIAVFTLTTNNINALNAKPISRQELTSSTGSLSNGPIPVSQNGAANSVTIGAGDALVVYLDAATADLSAAQAGGIVGKLNIIIAYRELSR